MKLENLKEMGDFLDRYYLPKLNVNQIINFNRSITPFDTEAFIKISQSKKFTGQTILEKNITYFKIKANANILQIVPQNGNKEYVPIHFS